MSQARVDCTQSAFLSCRQTLMLNKRVSWTLMQSQLYGNLQSPVSAAGNPLALQHCRSALCLPSHLAEAVQEDVPKYRSLSLEGKGYKQSSRWQTAPQQPRWALGWMEEGTEPEQPCSGQRTRRWLNCSQFLMKGLCRAGDGSNGQLIVLAWMNGWAAWRDQHWDLHWDLGPCLGPVLHTLCVPIRILCAVSGAGPQSCPAS